MGIMYYICTYIVIITYSRRRRSPRRFGVSGSVPTAAFFQTGSIQFESTTFSPSFFRMGSAHLNKQL